MTVRRAFQRFSTILVGLGVWVALTAPVVAQDFVKVDEAGREQLPATPFIGAAYGFIWVAVLVYALSIARRLGRIKGEIEDLRRRIDRGGGNPPARP